MYVLVRTDLPFPQQVVQACHASIEAARHFLPPDHVHPHVIVCGVPNESQLRHWLDRLTLAGIRHRAFFEPDLDAQLTAIAAGPVFRNQRRFFRKFPLLQSPVNGSPRRLEARTKGERS